MILFTNHYGFHPVFVKTIFLTFFLFLIKYYAHIKGIKRIPDRPVPLVQFRLVKLEKGR